jgi:hypothetical protein
VKLLRIYPSTAHVADHTEGLLIYVCEPDKQTSPTSNVSAHNKYLYGMNFAEDTRK